MHNHRPCKGRTAVFEAAYKKERPDGWKPAPPKMPHNFRANHTYWNKHARKGLTLGSM